MKPDLERILKILRNEYPDREPLLEYHTPFQLLIAVILSAQTTDEGVNRITPELFSLYPDAAALAAAPRAALERIIHPTGFFHVKAAAIKESARILVRNYDGQVPEEMEQLLSLPGVGRKTAGVLRAVLYGKPAVIVDTHFSRVLLRIGLTDTRDPLLVERQVMALFQEQDWTDLSQTVNRHGRRYCRARAPLCRTCPLLKLCSFAASRPEHGPS